MKKTYIEPTVKVEAIETELFLCNSFSVTETEINSLGSWGAKQNANDDWEADSDFDEDLY